MQSAVQSFLVIFALLFVLGKDKRFSLNEHFKSKDQPLAFVLLLVCIAAFAISLVDFVQDWNQVYGED